MPKQEEHDSFLEETYAIIQAADLVITRLQAEAAAERARQAQQRRLLKRKRWRADRDRN